jgi:hypothetical protein
MQSKIYENFEVFDNGEIYLLKDGCRKKLNQYKTSRDGKYRCVSVTENGVQKHYSVHRLVANAFIPNPENKPQVNHIDGDPSNNCVDNLEWVTGKENVLHAYKNIRPKYACCFCGKDTFSPKKVCKKCSCREREREKQRNIKKNKIIDFQNSIDVSKLNDRQKVFYNLYLSGLTQTEIARRYGLTRQAVSMQFLLMRKRSAKT